MEDPTRFDASSVLDSARKRTSDTTLKIAYLWLIIDYLLRWILLELRNYGLIAEWIFWLGHLFVAAIIGSILVARWTRLEEKRQTMAMFREVSGWKLLSVSIGAFSGIFVTYSLYPAWAWWLRLLFAIAMFIVYLYYSFTLTVLSLRSKTVGESGKQSEAHTDTRVPIDTNDERIVHMETEIASISQRIDSFTLESALFGALAFSGFLTLIASEKHVLENTQNFLTNLANIARSIREFDFSGLQVKLDLLSTSDYLIGAIAVQTLVCAMFFVSVIVSRLRFYKFLKKVDYAIRMARRYNEKEEQVYLLSLELSSLKVINDGIVSPNPPASGPSDKIAERLENLTGKVDEALDSADSFFIDLLFLTRFIGALRYFGIIAFVLIILTGAFLISPNLGLLSIILFAAALLYTVVDSWLRNKKVRKILFFSDLEKGIQAWAGKKNRGKK